MADSIPSDDDLLDRYARMGERAALGELARRHVDFVYASARRQVGDPHLAEDVTQAVFVLLMRKTRSIPRGRLTGWLFKATRYAAANARKIRARRQHHEHLAAGQQGEMTMPTEPAETGPLLKVLDDGLAALGATDREALMLRYLQGREVAEVGATLGLSEGACRRRISRAVEKLRVYFGGKGITAMETAAVMGVLQAAGTEKSPAGAVIGSMETPIALAIASAAATSMVMVKVKIAALVVIALTMSVGTMQIAIRRSSVPAAPVAILPDPRDTVRALGQAIFTGDIATARALAFGAEQDLTVLDALASPATAAVSFNRALDNRFGGGPPQLAYNVDFGFRDLPDRAKFTIEGDLATTSNFYPLHLRLIDGKWRVDGAHMSRHEHWAGSAIIAGAIAKSLDQARAEVESGLYPDRFASLSATGKLSDESVRRAAATTSPLGYSLKVPGAMPAVELQTDPRETVIAFAEAVRSGDAQKAKELVYGDGVDLTFVDSMAGAMLAQQKLNQAVDLKFGKAALPLVDLRLLAQWARSANHVFAFVKGDIAELPNPGGEVTMRLRAIDGHWRIDGKLLTEGRVDRLINLANDRRDVFDRLRAQMDADYYPSREALAASLVRVVNESRERNRVTKASSNVGLTVYVDGTSAAGPDPRDVLRRFAGAIRAGDIPASRREAHGSEADLVLIDAYARALTAQSKLNRLVDERFGPSGKPMLQMSLFEDLDRAAEPALIRITRDRAELVNPDGQVALQFAAVENRWRIDMSLMAIRMGREQSVLQPAMADVAERLQAQIEAGGFQKRESVQLGIALAARDARFHAGANVPPTATLPTEDQLGSQLDPSPRDVAKFFAMAVVSGDWGVARLFAAGPEERLALVDTLAVFSLAQQKLNLLVNEKFGPSRTPLLNVKNIEDWVVRAPRGEQTIKGTDAELLMPGGEEPLRFRRVDGRWRIDVTDFGPKDGSAMDAMARMLPVIESLPAEIAAGKFENRAQLVAELSNRLQPHLAAVGVTTRPAATRPATMPVVDHSDPTSVVKALFPTIMTGDTAAARALAFGSERDFAMIDGLCSAVRASRELDKIMEEKFGPGMPRFAIEFTEKNAIDQMQLVIGGDEAEFTHPAGNKYRLRLIDQRWRIDIATYPAQQREILGIMVATGIAMEELRRDIEAGVFKDRVAAFTAIQKRLQEEIKKAAPATQP